MPDYKFPNNYTGLQSILESLSADLPLPGKFAEYVGIWRVFVHPLKYNRVYVFRAATELAGAAWTGKRWRGRISYIIQFFSSGRFIGPNYSDLVLDPDTPHTFERHFTSSPRDWGEYSFRFIVQASCYNAEGTAPFPVSFSLGAESWEVASHEA